MDGYLKLSTSTVETAPLSISVSIKGITEPLAGNAAFPAVPYTVYVLCSEAGAVERRFSDFERLWRMLVSVYPAQIVPPIPSKRILNRFDDEVVEGRRYDFESALNWALHHPVLKKDQFLLAFVTIERFFECCELIKNELAPIVLPDEYFKGSLLNAFGPERQVRLPESERAGRRLNRSVVCLLRVRDRIDALRSILRKLADQQADCSGALTALSGFEDWRSREAGHAIARHGVVSGDWRERVGQLSECMRYVVRYLSEAEGLRRRWERVYHYRRTKREELASVSSRIHKISSSPSAKISFDLLYNLKCRQEKLQEELSVVEENYAKFTELCLEELDYVRMAARLRFREVFQHAFDEDLSVQFHK